MLSNLETLDLDFSVYHTLGGTGSEVALKVLGGYEPVDETDTDTVILFRYPADGLSTPQDGMMLLFGNGYVKPVRDDSIGLYADSGDWDTFAKLGYGATFRLGEKMWRKMTKVDLEDRVSGRIFMQF